MGQGVAENGVRDKDLLAAKPRQAKKLLEAPARFIPRKGHAADRRAAPTRRFAYKQGSRPGGAVRRAQNVTVIHAGASEAAGRPAGKGLE